MTRSFAPIVGRRRLVLALFALAAAVATPGILRLRVDNAPAGFFVDDALARARLRRLEHDFGRDRGVRLVVCGERLWTTPVLDWLGQLERRVAEPGEVYAAAGLYRHHAWHLPAWPPPDPQSFAALVASGPLDRDAGWVSADGRMVTVLAGLFDVPAAQRDAALETIEQLLADGPAGLGTALVGLPVVERALDQAELTVAWRFYPLLLVVAVGLLGVAFRRLAGVLVPLALVGVVLVVLLGAMGYAGQRLDIVTVILIPLVFVIALATGVHVLATQRRLLDAGLDPVDATLATYEVKAWPVLWTGITTAIGFGSLVVSDVPPVRALGLWAAFGIAYATLAALAFYPALLARPHLERRSRRRVGPVPEGGTLGWLAVAGRRWAGWAVAHRRSTAAGFAIVALLALPGFWRLRVATGVLGWFAPEHPARLGVEALEARGIGAVSASLVLEAWPLAPGFDDPAALARLRELAAALRAAPGALGAVGAGDLVASVAARLDPAPTGDERGRLAAARQRIRERRELGELLSSLLTADGHRTRVLLPTRMASAAELEPLLRRAEQVAGEWFPDAGVWVSGQYPLVVAAERRLLVAMVLSLSLALLAIAGLLRGLLGSARLALRALLPNAWPVVVVLGGMGWLGVPVDAASLMVGCVVLGLAVDDTLHTLGHLRRHWADAASEPRQAVATSLGEVVPGHVTTSAVLGLGFAVCGFSALVPVARFGALCALAMGLALLADLLLVPALLAGTTTDERSRLTRGGG